MNTIQLIVWIACSANNNNCILLNNGFKYRCNISNCPKTYTNAQSFRRHLKCAHRWFYETHFSDKEHVVDDGDNTENNDDYGQSDNDIGTNNFDDPSDKILTDLAASFVLELRHCFDVNALVSLVKK